METFVSPQRLLRAVGTASPAANGLVSTFTIAHGLSTTPKHVAVQARNALSAATSFVTADATNITITFLSVPLLGTLSFYWSAEA